jgi:hypothetical protein
VPKGVQFDPELVELWWWLVGGIGGGRFTINPIAPTILSQIGHTVAYSKSTIGRRILHYYWSGT